MQSIIQRFVGFDRLLGPVLVKIVYYFGAAAIVLLVGVALVTSLLSLVAGNIGAGIMQMLAAPAVGAVALVYWRFICEIFMLAFLAYERLGEMNARLAGVAYEPDPDHPQF